MAAGWKLKSGELKNQNISDDQLWALFNFVFSDSSRKRNTYKFGLIKSLLDNLFNAELIDDTMFMSYTNLFGKFAENYWNLVVKYHLKQMRFDGRSEYSKVETIFRDAVEANPIISSLNFDALEENEKNKLINQVTIACKMNVVGALYEDMNGVLYAFDLKGKGVFLSIHAYEFMLKFKMELEKINYYSWAKFLEQVNDGNVLIGLLDKLELATPQRSDLSIYREILYKEFQENNCFYCGKKLGNVVHVDHFIPWSYVKDDKLWNFVLSCPTCNTRKNNKIPSKNFLIKIQKRNHIADSIQNKIVREDFMGYEEERLKRLWKYAQLSGMKEFCG